MPASLDGFSANHCAMAGMCDSNEPGIERLSTPARISPRFGVVGRNFRVKWLRIRPNKTELSRRWRSRAFFSLHPSAFPCAGQRLAGALG